MTYSLMDKNVSPKRQIWQMTISLLSMLAGTKFIVFVHSNIQLLLHQHVFKLEITTSETLIYSFSSVMKLEFEPAMATTFHGPIQAYHHEDNVLHLPIHKALCFVVLKVKS